MESCICISLNSLNLSCLRNLHLKILNTGTVRLKLDVVKCILKKVCYCRHAYICFAYICTGGKFKSAPPEKNVEQLINVIGVLVKWTEIILPVATGVMVFLFPCKLPFLGSAIFSKVTCEKSLLDACAWLICARIGLAVFEAKQQVHMILVGAQYAIFTLMMGCIHLWGVLGEVCDVINVPFCTKYRYEHDLIGIKIPLNFGKCHKLKSESLRNCVKIGTFFNPRRFLPVLPFFRICYIYRTAT